MRFTHLARLAGLAALAVLLLPQLAVAGDRDTGARDKKAFFDSRTTPAADKVLNARERDAAATASPDIASFKASLGREGIVDIDPLTNTPRFVGKTDGFLTRPSSRAPADIALDFLRKNATVFGITAADVDNLQLRQDYVSIDGTHHLSFVQSQAGIPVFANGIKANVTSRGEIINFTGSPVAFRGAIATKPNLTATDAVVAAKDDAGQTILPAAALANGLSVTHDTTFTDGDSASLVYFQGADDLHLAWSTTIWGTDNTAFQTVVDSSNGQILYRRSLVNFANGLAWDNYPGATVGGTQHTVDLSKWLTPGATTLTGPNAHVYSDINDDNADNAGEDIPTSDAAGNFNYSFQPFGTPPFGNTINSDCTALFPCSWDSSFPSGVASWQVNRKQNGVQVFFFVNTFHDHLAAAPIGFTEAAGAFQGADSLNTEPDDGAGVIRLRLANGTTIPAYPDPNHTDNANMATPPDGQHPRMQMFLFNDPASDDPAFGIGGTPRADPFIQSNGGDEADVVYHEFTHGLSNRLVVDATGNSTLGNGQSGSMGEAWSDWYAMDFLVNLGNFVDTPADGDLRIGHYVGAGQDLIRSQPMDCPVGSTSPKCHGTSGGGPGGYTYGDFGKIIGRPEVHADGEIWGETLWDLRSALGSATTEGIVTRAMELSPSDPSYLDMRNSILEADVVDNGGANHDTIWHVFANRGMGYFAASLNGDLAPAEDFSMPPIGDANGKLRGTITDADSGQPIAGAVVQFGGHDSGFTGTLAAVTDAKGRYKVKHLFPGTYPKVQASAIGFDPQVTTVTITGGDDEDGNAQGKDDDQKAARVNFAIRRDFASFLGGGTIAAFNGPDFTGFGCGPASAIDQSETAGWGSTTDGDDGAATGKATPKFVVVKLPVAVNVSEIDVNPSNTCGDAGSASTRGFKVEVSSDGTTFTQVAKGVFYLANRNKENPVVSGATLANVRFVKFWMLNPQVPSGASCTGAADCGADPDVAPGLALRCTPPNVQNFSGCRFMDMSEIKVFGKAA